LLNLLYNDGCGGGAVVIMSLFKYKPPKKIILDERSITTLDSKHKELQGEFQYIQDTIIPELENERNSLKER